MKQIILAWLNANASNEAKAKEIEYHTEKFAIEFADWMRGFRYDNAELYFRHATKELLEIYKKEKEL